MSEKNGSPKSVARIACALCMLSSGAASAGEIAPKLLKTTTPIRVSASPTATAGTNIPQRVSTTHSEAVTNPRFERSSQTGEDAAPLRSLLNPHVAFQVRSDATSSTIAQTSGGTARINHFVELQGDDSFKKPAQAPATRSAAVPQRSHRRRGEIRKNPLIVDSPPKLRRFDVDDRPLNLPVTESNDQVTENLVIQQQPLPPRPVASLDQTLEMLSADTESNTAVLGAAKTSGFGTLAMDQIGGHLEPAADPNDTITYRPLQRYATDLVLPDESMAGLAGKSQDDFGRQLESIDSSALVDDNTPVLPKGSETPEMSPPVVALNAPAAQLAANSVDTIVLDSESFDSGALNAGLSQPIAPVVNGQVALDIEQLMAASGQQAQAKTTTKTKRAAKVEREPAGDKTSLAERPSFAERLASWSRKLTPNPSTSPTQPAVSQPIPEAASEIQADTPVQPVSRRRSGGLLNQWLNRSR